MPDSTLTKTALATLLLIVASIGVAQQPTLPAVPPLEADRSPSPQPTPVSPETPGPAAPQTPRVPVSGAGWAIANPWNVAFEPGVAHALLLGHDVDRSGDLTAEEIAAPLRGDFTRTDWNRDGRLDAGELLLSNTEIGRLARDSEGLRLSADGGLVGSGGVGARPPVGTGFPSGGGAGIAGEVGRAIVREVDRNRDGRIDRWDIEGTVFQPKPLLGRLKGIAGAMIGNRVDPRDVEQAAGVLQALDVDGNQVLDRTEAAGPLVENFDRLDRDRNGVLDVVEIARGLRFARALGMPIETGPAAPASPDGLRPVPTGPGAAQGRPSPIAPQGSQPAPATSEPATGELPSAAKILENLDKDGDGKLSRSEAVDQLAQNFDRLDTNRDGFLDEAEIDRGLKLARLFGIKPMADPSTYADPEKSD